MGEAYLADARRQFRKYKELADRAMAQVDDAAFFSTLGSDDNSIALIVKHLAGNMRSRWTDFLTTDGDKPDRHRDTEFEWEERDTRASLFERWETGWRLLFDAVGTIGSGDLDRTVTIRGEPHSVLEAVSRQLTHYAYHVGQIVFLAKHFAGARWMSLSIPKGRSQDLDVSKDGGTYGVH